MVVQDRFRVAHVAGKREHAGITREQRLRVPDDKQVVVQVRHLRRGRDQLSYLVRVHRGGQTGPDIDELMDALLRDGWHQVATAS